MAIPPHRYPPLATSQPTPASTSPPPQPADSIRHHFDATAPRAHTEGHTQPAGRYTSPSIDDGATQYHEAGDIHMADADLGLSLGSTSDKHKRSYRQRRKDPSCDLCRERKVKCDATDVSACTECSSRNHHCTFTKETNRRMSSLKQVQDLERQLDQAKAQISKLKGVIKETNSGSRRFSPSGIPAVPVSHPRDRESLSKNASGFFKVRRNIRNYGRGIFKPPHAYRVPGPSKLCEDEQLGLPTRAMTQHLLSQYRAVYHPLLPVLHWPTFQDEVDQVYRRGTLKGVRSAWIATFFGILACASTISDDRVSDEQGLMFCSTAGQQINTMSDEITIDHARSSLMLSVFFMETNRRSAAWIWLGAAVRTAQESGLFVESNNHGQMQQELRRRLWWAVYSWDRQCSLDLGQSLDGADPDVEVGEPAPVDDEYITESGMQWDSGSAGPSSLLVLIPTVRVIHSLKKTLKSKTIPPAAIKAFDEHFEAIMKSYPDPFPINSTTPLDPAHLHPALALQINKFMLHRHNLNQLCRMQEREEALTRCIGIAKDTAHYIWRTTPAARLPHAHPSHPAEVSDPDWKGHIRYSLPSFVIKHLWRCALILCFTNNYSHASTIITVLEAVGTQKKVNVACGRNLAFFLDLLAQKLQTTKGQDRELDEEMLAYASGDLQGSSYCAWVWTGSDARGNSAMDSGPGLAMTPKDSITSETLVTQPVLLTKAEELEWGGWSKVQDLVQNLQYLQNSTVPGGTTGSHYSPNQAAGRDVHLTSADVSHNAQPRYKPTTYQPQQAQQPRQQPPQLSTNPLPGPSHLALTSSQFNHTRLPTANPFHHGNTNKYPGISSFGGSPPLSRPYSQTSAPSFPMTSSGHAGMPPPAATASDATPNRAAPTKQLPPPSGPAPSRMSINELI